LDIWWVDSGTTIHISMSLEGCSVEPSAK
jgi:hypothetical protein